MRFQRALPIVLAPVLFLAACEGDPEPPASTHLSVAELKDPETCMGCHPTHYREWKASMHAYSTDDPVFVAMNKVAHDDTDGELGTFCVNCHAPLAVKDGLTDGSPESIEALPDHMKGVTCYFCHNASDVTGENNAEVTIANDTVMRGGIVGALEPEVHGVAYSKFMNRFGPDSSRLCGGCHDIVNDNGVHLERTFAEYKEYVFSHAGTPAFQSCVSCHMPVRQGLAASKGADTLATRFVSSHLWPGVDVALTPWPDRDLYKAAVECALDSQAIAILSPSQDIDGITYPIETLAGHKMPSGASQDRRLWVEVRQFDAISGGNELCTLGAVPDGVAAVDFRDPDECPIQDVPSSGPRFPLFRDRVFDEAGEETHRFDLAAPSPASETGYINNALPTATMVAPDGLTAARHTVELTFMPLPEAKRITVRMRMRPMDFDVLDELIDADVLDPAVRDEVPTFTISSSSYEYVMEGGVFEARPTPERETNCYDANVCAFDPDAPNCD